MIQPISRAHVIPAGDTVQIPLHPDERFTKTTVAVRVGTVGVLSFRAKPLYGQYETPEAPNTLDMAARKSIYFDGAALEELEIANPGAQEITVVIGQVAG
jgi:hypothetical protein